jgi:O-antigen ligase
MPAWNHALTARFPILTVGRLLLIVAVLTLIAESRRPRDCVAVGRAIMSGPPALLLGAGALCLLVVLVSSHTNGCQCSGGLYGLVEMAAWALLVLVVVILRPETSVPILGAVVGGAVIAGVLALAGVRAHGEVSAQTSRLLGSYGNPNFLAATQALAFPAAIAAAATVRNQLGRLAAAAAAIVLFVVNFLTYSRAGLLAAICGGYLTAVLLLPRSKRLGAGAALAVAVVAISALLYPTYTRLRTDADFGSAATAAAADGVWRTTATGLIAAGPASLERVESDGATVTTQRPDEGVSVGVGVAGPRTTYRLRFEARSLRGDVPLGYGLEDDTIGAGPRVAAAVASADWRTYSLDWRPSRLARHARAYFWLGADGAFELRSLALSRAKTGGRAAPATPLRPSGGGASGQRVLARAERGFVQARIGALRLAIDAFTSHPWRGIGWERFPTYAARRSGVGPIATHDEYVRFAAELGIPGMVALLLLALSVLWAVVSACSDGVAPALAGTVVAAAISLGFANLLETPDAALALATAAACVVALSARRPLLRRDG